jgi:cobalt-zinc-cadmium efflux system outer membrane protein
MSIPTKLTLIILTVALLSPSTGHGETVDQLTSEALRNNPEQQSFEYGIAAAQGAVRTAGTIRNPELNTQAGYKNSRDNSGGGNGDGPTWAVTFTQTFEYPGRIALRKAIANHDVDLARLYLMQFRLTLVSRVRTLAYGMVMARNRSASADEAANRFQSLTDVLEQRPAAGVTPQLEARLIASNSVVFRRLAREAALSEKTMTAELNQLCGRAADRPLQVSADSVTFAKPELPDLLRAARANAFEIRIRQLELTQQGFKVALSRNERYPAIAVGPYYSIEKAADTEHQAGLGASLPLPLWDRNAGNIATSKAREDQARASLEATVRDVERRVKQGAEILRAKRDEIEQLGGDELNRFRDAAELADRNYRLGGVPLAIYVEAQKQYVDLIAALADLQKDALQAAQDIEILTGVKLYHSSGKP